MLLGAMEGNSIPGMIDPMDALIDFRRAVAQREIRLQPADFHPDVFVHVDQPAGAPRYTYALTEGGDVMAVALLALTEPIEGVPTFQLGYAVIESRRGCGRAQRIAMAATAAVLGRGAMLALDISRIFGSGFAILDRFERDDMLPVVAHVVSIEDLASAPVDQGFKLGIFGRRQLIVRPVRIGKAVSFVAHFELPEMIIEPAHRALDDIVQHLEVGIDWNFDPPPDRGFCIGKRDVQAGDSLGHAALLTAMGLTGATSTAQFHGMSSSQREAGQPEAIFSIVSVI